MAARVRLLFLLVLTISPACQSWSLFSSSSPATGVTSRDKSVAEFSMNGVGDEKGKKKLESAKNKLDGSNNCWQKAYEQLFAAGSEILEVEEKRSRLAWHLSVCFQKDTGRKSFPYCDTKNPMVDCLKKLDENEHKVYLEFLLETNSICYQLQAHSFKHKMERLVNDLKGAAEYTADQLEIMSKGMIFLSESSNQIHEALGSIYSRVQNVAKSTIDVKDHMKELSRHSEAVYKQSINIAETQSGLGG